MGAAQDWLYSMAHHSCGSYTTLVAKASLELQQKRDVRARVIYGMVVATLGLKEFN